MLSFAYTIYLVYTDGIATWHFWVSPYHYAVNLSGGQPRLYFDAYAVLGSANDMKFHVFVTKHKANTCYEHLIHSDDWDPI